MSTTTTTCIIQPTIIYSAVRCCVTLVLVYSLSFDMSFQFKMKINVCVCKQFTSWLLILLTIWPKSLALGGIVAIVLFGRRGSHVGSATVRLDNALQITVQHGR